MGIAEILNLLGGVALFLFGMTLMGDGLKQVAGNKLEVILYKLSGTPLKGILLGTGVTAVIQSSSATSVMVVGFVNSGMMQLRQAISIIMGAIIGTSVTGWIVALSDLGSGTSGVLALFSTEAISAVVAVIGIYFRMFSKRRSDKHLGNIMMGFAVLMFGMKAMSSSVSSLRSSQTFIGMLTTLSNPIVAILIGLVFTTLIQSASAAVGILQALASTGAISFAAAFPLLMGIAIGAAVPVLLSALGAEPQGKKAALSYLVIDILGSILIGVLFYGLNAIVGFGFMGLTLKSVNIALLNTVYRLLAVALTIPCLGLIERIVNFFVKEEKSANKELDQINAMEERFLNYPPLAVEHTRIAINAMGELALKNISDAMALYQKGYTEQGFCEVERIESIIDKYEESIGTYLVRLSGQAMTTELARKVGLYLHTITDFERISDRAMNIAERAQEIREKNITFSEAGKKELEVLMAAISRILELMVSSFVSEDIPNAYQIEPLEETIDDLCEQIKLNHVERVTRGECTLLNGYVFNDLLGNYERISDHCSNVAATMIELQEGMLGMHKYTNEVKDQHTHNFEQYYRQFKETYTL